ncbi:hypothetical protein KR222_002217, partial [Zaprionus bogoriensis]
VLQRLCRPQLIRLPLTCCMSSNRSYANTPATAPAAPTAIESARKSLDLDPGITDWRPIYRLPLIRLVAAINRLKFYQAAATVAGTPIAFALAQANQISGEALGVSAAIGVTGLMTLTLSSVVLTNVIGFIYVNEQQDQVKIAYVDFWGRRKETLVDIEDLLPDWELKRSRRFGIYQPICLRNGSKERYKLLQRFGIVEDPLLFEGLFGQ